MRYLATLDYYAYLASSKSVCLYGLNSAIILTGGQHSLCLKFPFLSQTKSNGRKGPQLPPNNGAKNNNEFYALKET
jgi:hypothetical protein